MSGERTQDYDVPFHGESNYDIPSDMVKNASYCATKKRDEVNNTIATSHVLASSNNVNNSENSKKEYLPVTKKCGIQLTFLMALQIGIAFFIVAVVSSILFVQISMLCSEVALLKSSVLSMETTLDAQFSELKDRLSADVSRLELDAVTNLTRLDNGVNIRLENISDSLSIPLNFINQVISKTTGNNKTLEAIFVDVLYKNGYSFISCAAILQLAPSSPSGNYHVVSSNGSYVSVYCDMTRTCGNITGGWMRVAELDMTDTTTQCPSSLELRKSPRRTCETRTSGLPTCSLDTFTVDGVQYSKVCGRIRAYQVGSIDAFGNSNSAANSGRGTSNPNIETYYVDGVSLTHGTSPRQHIWIFASDIYEDYQNFDNGCSCINSAISRRLSPLPSFVSENYFCHTAAITGVALVFYADDPLWDGAGCGDRNTCCSFNPPWFYRQLPQFTTDDIEMRVCRDEGTNNENIAIEVVEIYVQ